jgi:hypothetical protein
MKLQLLALSVIAGLAVGCGKSEEAATGGGSNVLEAWKPHDAPINLDASFARNINALPSSATLATQPWPDTYWPSYEGGVSSRWNSSNPQPFKYVPPTLAELRTMTKDQLMELSPAEKFDIFRGDYNYSLVQSERSRTSPSDESWEGICHGWAPASTLFAEPQPVVLSNADGIAIPFGSADVKAMLSYYQGQVAQAPTQFLGLRCNIKIDDYDSARANEDDCKGVNAGAFHIVLANQIGIKNKSFIADVVRDFQVWNHPISGFTSSIQSKAGVGPNAAPGTVRELQVQTTMYYVVESTPQWTSLVASDYTTARTYSYTLELNASDEIIGGEWLQNDRPDFLWTQERVPFTRGFEALERLYEASTTRN